MRKGRHERGVGMSTNFDDATFFDMIHRLLGEQDEPPPAERRQGSRRPFDCVQLLAPYEGALPAQADFRLVRCQDISPHGFSFVAEREPHYRFVIVALGTIPFTFFVAEIMRVTPQDFGAPLLVGCRFVRRLGK